ncbi:MAG: hypothetical protein EPO11_01045, partial [Gammaproteobacteria bacterium]
QRFKLKEIIQQMPYAIFLVEKMEQAPTAIIEELQEIMSVGVLQDEHGRWYDFRQAIFLLSTAVGANRLAEVTTLFSPQQEREEVNFMQLIMNELKQESTSIKQDYSPQELVDVIMPEMIARFPSSLCQQIPMIPFLPLTKMAVEKIIRLKLKLLGKMLDSRYSVELGYAPEVVRYLANEVLTQEAADTDKVLRQLYFVIEQAMMSQKDDKNRPTQLFLQLNETGQLLRCDWLMMPTMRHQVSSGG